MKKNLRKIFDKNSSGQINKWSNYFEIYERSFEKFVGSEVVIVEFGVFQGGSLRMWKEYFGSKCQVYGIDINPLTKTFEEDRIKVIIGSQDDENFLSNLACQIPNIDIIIDDGGHTMSQQINTFNAFYNKLKPTGVYVCEDMHTSYQLSFDGGYKNKKSFVEYSKKLIDSLMAWQSEDERLKVSEFTRTTYSMTYYESVLVIEKRPITQPVPVTTGKEIVENYQYIAKRNLIGKSLRKLRSFTYKLNRLILSIRFSLFKR